VTEIPEHLLKRSRDRRAALSGDSGGEAGADAGAEAAPAAATPATTTPASGTAPAPAAPTGRGQAVTPAAPPPPKPDSAVVAAYKRRKRIPFWAMLALSLLPVWAFMYARAVTTQAEVVEGPLGVGDETYGVCASCHGGSGEGGVGRAFTNGEVLLTFPHIEDQLRFVYYGTEAYEAAGVDSYGDPDREGGAHTVRSYNGAAMPAQAGDLTDAEILGVVCHERYTLGGAETTGEFAEEYEKWCSEESEIFTDLEGGGDIRTLEERFDDIIPIGNEPVPGSPAGAPAGE
jgi:mono/diheme cytochrome c family protein